MESSNDGKSVVDGGKSTKLGSNAETRVNRRSYLMSRVNEFCDFLKGTKISSECKEVKKNVGNFRNYENIIGTVAKFGAQFKHSPDPTIQSFMEPFGFLRSHFDDKEWKIIKAYTNLIFEYVTVEIFQTLS